MMNAFLITFLAGLSTLVGSFFIFLNIKEKNKNKFISFCLSFSISIMIILSTTELIPHSIINIIYNYGVGRGQILIYISIILAYIIIKLLNRYMDQNNTNDLYKLGILSMISLIIHNIPEGIIVFTTACTDMSIATKLAFAITLHNIPEGIIIAVPIYYATKSKSKAITYTLIAGLSEPLGALISYIFIKDLINTAFIDMTLIFVGSLMILLSIEDIFPKAIKYKENKYLYGGFIVGIILSIVNILL